jgi:CheY-like chemotaxis protein
LRADVDADLAATSRTGGIPWSSARFLAERLLLGVHRSNAVASLCVVQFDESDDLAQIDAVQEQLLREFRTDDIVTRSGDRETILVLGGVDRAVSSSRLEGMAGRLSTVGIRVGIAEFPYDAQSVGDLVTEARTLVERSRAEDGPRVVSADWHPGGLVAHDVIIADSDPAVARVVGEALERSGVSVAHISDGQLLLERLQSPNVRLPKVLILEFDLLGVDGLTILRRLKRKSALRRFDVVMLSARTREADIRQAYDLGVTEVIAKPFSPGILVRRLLRLMEVEL